MAIKRITIEEYFNAAADAAVIDVRSPAEFAHAHIPGAVSLPLFSDEERKTVGTLYKQESREAAIKAGLDFFGPKMRTLVEEAEHLVENSGNKSRTIVLHCWRGGMRSAAMAWLLDMYGFKISVIAGGYKSYRGFILTQLSAKRPLHIIGGYSGSGKSDLLSSLQKSGETIIDLELLANHRGSALGGIGRGKQPSQEMFENLLGVELFNSALANRIFAEDESQRIGNLQIPSAFWSQMRLSPLLFLEVPFENRLAYVIEEYGNLPVPALKEAVQRISKRLGGLDVKTASTFLDGGDIENAFRILLRYYDKHYSKALSNRSSDTQVTKIAVEKISAPQNAAIILNELSSASENLLHGKN